MKWITQVYKRFHPEIKALQEVSVPSRRILITTVIIALLALALFSIVNSFFRHLTPDNSVYLLHARTFLNTLNRFELSHGSKGIVLSFLLLPGVGLLGSNITTVAVSQIFIHSIGIFFFFLLLRHYLSADTAVILGLLYIVIAYSPGLWGGNGRPEDFCLMLSIIALYAGLRGSNRWFIICGTMVSLIFFIKISLALAPAFMGISAAFMNIRNDRYTSYKKKVKRYIKSSAANTGLLLLGFSLPMIIILIWIIIFDDLSCWYRQNIQWPMEYREAHLSIAFAGNIFLFLKKAGINWLFYGCLAGLIFGWIKGPRRLVLLITILITVDFMRIMVEIIYPPGWNYVLLPLLIPMLLGTSFLGATRQKNSKSIIGWLIPVCLSVIILKYSVTQTLKSFELRVIHGLPSPYEYFAKEMRPVYSQGESIFVDSNDYQLLFFLDAPRPYPILPHHINFSSKEEMKKIHQYYATSPPDWVIKREPEHSAIYFSTLGQVDSSFHIYLPSAEKDRIDQDAKYYIQGEVRIGKDLNKVLPSSQQYRLVIDIGYLQAWRIL